jgi:HSP20 family protein
MTLNRWDPFRDLLNVQERVHRCLDYGSEDWVAKRQTCWCPPTDVLETPDKYILRIELPGVGKENISIELAGNRLRLYGERLAESEPALAAYHSIERVHGLFERTFTLPGEVDPDGAEASYSDGILEIVLPKAEHRKEARVMVVWRR